MRERGGNNNNDDSRSKRLFVRMSPCSSRNKLSCWMIGGAVPLVADVR